MTVGWACEKCWQKNENAPYVRSVKEAESELRHYKKMTKFKNQQRNTEGLRI